jgi:hypothetical protein
MIMFADLGFYNSDLDLAQTIASTNYANIKDTMVTLIDDPPWYPCA